MRRTQILFSLLVVLLLQCTATVHAGQKLKALLIDGQNNHDWKHTTPMLKWILEDSGRFVVDVSTTPPVLPSQPRKPGGTMSDQQKAKYESDMAQWKADQGEAREKSAKLWEKWHPRFADYAVIISNYNGQDWPDPVKADFLQYMKNGGGFVCIHAANNAFPHWLPYNQMIGLAGWNGRNEKSGPMIRLRDGKFIQDDSPGAAGTRGVNHSFLVEVRAAEHPIMRGLPAKWLGPVDELYGKLRGPAENLTILATAYSDTATHGTAEDEPILMAVNFGKGRGFQTTLGHNSMGMEGLGFQVTLCRGPNGPRPAK